MNGRTLAAVVLAAMLLVPGVALAGVTGSPDLDAYVPNNTVEPGTETTLSVTVTNSGTSRQVAYRSGEVGGTATAALRQQVTTARNLRAELRAGGAPVDVLTDVVPIGQLPDGGARQAQFRLAVEEGADPGTYRLPLDLSYSHADQIDGTGEVLDRDEDTEEEHVTIRITESARFEIVNVSTGAQIGGSGPVTLTMRNTGSEDASDTTLSLQSTSSDVAFGGSNTASQYLGNWSAGENRTIQFQATVSGDAITEPYALRTTVSFDNDNGVPTESQPLSTGIVPLPEQSFSLAADDSTLQVGREGNLSGTITNEGPATAHDAVVVFTPTSPNVNAQETEFALGTLDAGESASFSVPIEISTSGEPGRQQFTFRVQYQNEDDQQRQSEPLNTRTTIQSQQPLFDVELENATLPAGETRVVTLLVTNNGDGTLENLDARAFADGGLTLVSDEAYARQIGPGETEELTLELSAGASALPRTYSFAVDFQYLEDGETELSDTYSVPVDVTEPVERGGLPWGLIGVVAVVVVAAAAAVVRYRR